MLSSLGSKPFDSKDHLFEIKWDGIRALAFFGPAPARLQGRRLTDRSFRYPEVCRGLDKLTGSGILDGELIVLHGDKPSFESVLVREQTATADQAILKSQSHPVVFVAFDLLFRNDEPLIDKPLIDRKRALSDLLRSPPSPIVESQFVLETGRTYYQQASEQRLEGVMAKRINSPYRIGERTTDWQKLKIRQTIDCVLVATLREPGIERVKSLVLAVHDGKEMVWMGNVGSGLDHETLYQLQTQLRALESERPQGLVGDVPGRLRWLRPQLVVRVEYLELTRESRLRHPVFVGFVDKDPSQCILPPGARANTGS